MESVFGNSLFGGRAKASNIPFFFFHEICPFLPRVRSPHRRYDQGGWSPLCFAAMNGDPVLVSALLEKKASPNDATKKSKILATRLRVETWKIPWDGDDILLFWLVKFETPQLRLKQSEIEMAGVQSCGPVANQKILLLQPTAMSIPRRSFV